MGKTPLFRRFYFSVSAKPIMAWQYDRYDARTNKKTDLALS